LVREAVTRKWGGLVERRMVAAAYVVNPSVLGLIAADPARTWDRLLADYFIARAARVVKGVPVWSARPRIRVSGSRVGRLDCGVANLAERSFPPK
jgi:hypothetical protein